MAEDGIFRKVHWPIGHQFEETPGDKDREAWFAKSMGLKRVGQNLGTEQQQKILYVSKKLNL